MRVRGEPSQPVPPSARQDAHDPARAPKIDEADALTCALARVALPSQPSAPASAPLQKRATKQVPKKGEHSRFSSLGTSVGDSGRKRVPLTPKITRAIVRMDGQTSVPIQSLPSHLMTAVVEVNAALSSSKHGGDLLWHGHTLHCEAIPGARGHRSALYGVSSNETLVPGRNNDSLCVKALHGDCIKANWRSIEEYMTKSMEQYACCVVNHLPVAALYNNPTSEGFFLVEYLPTVIDPVLLWPPEKSFLELTLEQQYVLNQLKRFFDFALNTLSCFDCSVRKFGLTNDGELKLLGMGSEFKSADTLRHKKDPESSRDMHLVAALRSWSQHNPQVLDYLCSSRSFAAHSPIAELAAELKR